MITINGGSHLPAVPGQHTDFVATLTKSPIQFVFKNETAFLQFLDDHAADHTGAPAKFKDTRYQRLFSPITGITCAARMSAAKWGHELKIATQHGDFDAYVFMSPKRHVLLSFLSNFKTPRTAKERNSVVRDADKLKACLETYRDLIVAALLKRGYAFRFDAKMFNTTLLNGDMVLEYDRVPISEDPARTTELHCYPASGPEVRNINDHLQYDALVTFLLWFFRTDQCTGEAAGYSEVEKIRREQKDTNYQQYVAKLQRVANETKKHYADLAKAGVDLKKTATTADGVHPSANGHAVNAAKKMHALLAAHGEVPRTDLPLRSAATDTDKPNLNKAAKTSPAGTVLFKTHKFEVSSKSKDIPWTVLEWLLHGHLQRDLGEIKIVIESYKVDKSKYASLATPPAGEDRTQAHSLPVKQRIGKEADRMAQGGATDLLEKINVALKWYRMAEASPNAMLNGITT